MEGIKTCFEGEKRAEDHVDNVEPEESQDSTEGGEDETCPFVPKTSTSSTIIADMAEVKGNNGDLSDLEAGINKSCSSEAPGSGSSNSEGKSSRNCVSRWATNISRKWNSLTRRQVVILSLFALVDLLAATVISIQAPFYPEVASSKGASATEYGLVFGIFEFTAIIFSPIFGANMKALGPNRVFTSGILITGSSSVIFGLLYKIEESSSFIGWCLAVRVLEAIGESAYVTASFTIIAIEFPDAVATTFAILETCYGLGMIAGPLAGGLLYDLGGYSLPFIGMGGLLFLSAFVTCILPARQTETSEVLEESSNESGTSQTDSQKVLVKAKTSDMLGLICIPSVALTSYGIVSTATGVGFLCALLEPHLRQFEMGKVTVGSVFILSGGVYALTAPFWGWLCDNHSKDPQVITTLGSLFSIVGFCLIGPLPFVPLDTILWVTCIGLVLFGLGLGAVYVSGFVIYLNDAIKRGYPDDVSTYGLVSGLWTAMVSLGYFIGPTMGGVLEDHVGFRWGCLFVLGAQLLLLCFLTVHFAVKSGKTTPAKKRSLEEQSNPRDLRDDS